MNLLNQSKKLFLSVSALTLLGMGPVLSSHQPEPDTRDQHSHSALENYKSAFLNKVLTFNERYFAFNELKKIPNCGELLIICQSIVNDEKFDCRLLCEIAHYYALIGKNTEAVAIYRKILPEKNLPVLDRKFALGQLIYLEDREASLEFIIDILKKKDIPSHVRLEIDFHSFPYSRFIKVEALKAAYEAILKEEVDPALHGRAAIRLKILGEESLGIKACLSMIHNKQTSTSARLMAANHLLEYFNEKGEAIQVYADIAHNPENEWDIRAQAIIRLCNQGEKKQVENIVLDIPDHSQFDSIEKINRISELINFFPNFAQEGIKCLISIVDNSKATFQLRIHSAALLLPLEREKANTIFNNLLNNYEAATVTARAIMNLDLNHQHLLDDDILFKAYSISETPYHKNAVTIHKNLLEKIQLEQNFTLKPQVVEESILVFNKKLFSPKAAHQESIPVVYGTTLHDILEDCINVESTNPNFLNILKQYFKDAGIKINQSETQPIVDSVSFYKEALTTCINDPFLKTYIKGDQLKEVNENNEISVKLHQIIGHIQSLKEPAKENYLSKRLSNLINLLARITQCETGKIDSVIELHGKFFMNEGEEVTSYDDKEDFIQTVTQRIIARERNKRDSILRDDSILISILQLNEAGEIKQGSHQNQYLRSLLGGYLGVDFEKKKTRFDLHAATILPQLLSCSAQDALEIFFKEYTVAGVVNRTHQFMNKMLDKELQGGKYLTQHYLDSLFNELKAPEDCFVKKDYPELDEEILTEITPKGAVTFLRYLGLLEEGKDLSSLTSTAPEKDSNKLHSIPSSPSTTHQSEEDDNISE